VYTLSRHLFTLANVIYKRFRWQAIMAEKSNYYDTREAWLRAATNELRPYFASCGLDLPQKLRFSIAFTSTGRKGKRVGECWHFSASGDQTYEIFIRADLAEPAAVLAVLAKELVHTVLPADAGHGKLFKVAALKIGLQGPMRTATPGVLLQKRLDELAGNLGPLPHAPLDISRQSMVSRAVAADGPKKQSNRYLKAECDDDGCGYTVRVVAKWVNEVGPPHCPKHGAMSVIGWTEPAAGENEAGILEELDEAV
jgi:hypothetical protein